MLAHVFENFANMGIKTYERDPGKLHSALTLARQAAFKKTKAKLDLLIDINMLLMIKKITDEEYFTLFINMKKLITTTWNITRKIKNYHIFNIGV